MSVKWHDPEGKNYPENFTHVIVLYFGMLFFLPSYAEL